MLGFQFTQYQNWIYPNKSEKYFWVVDGKNSRNPYHHPVARYIRQISKLNCKPNYKNREKLLPQSKRKLINPHFLSTNEEDDSWEVI